MGKAKAVTGTKVTETATPTIMKVEVSRINLIKDSKITLAYVDITLGGVFVVQGLRVVPGQKGLFVSMPQNKDKDNKWYDRAFPVTREMRNHIEDTVLKAYLEKTAIKAEPVAVSK